MKWCFLTIGCMFGLFFGTFIGQCSQSKLHATAAEERNASERERGFCGNPYDPNEWPRDEEPGCHAG